MSSATAATQDITQLRGMVKAKHTVRVEEMNNAIRMRAQNL